MPAGEQVFRRGQVTVCCPTDDDVHAVTVVGDEPTIGSTSTERTSARSGGEGMTPRPGKVEWFVGGWHDPRTQGPLGGMETPQ